MTEAIANEGGVFPQYSTALEEDRPIRVGNSVSEIQASSDSAGTVPCANPQRNKWSVDDGLRAVKAAALAVEQSFRLTDTQEAVIKKGFLLVREDDASLDARMLREKSKRSLQVRKLLRNMREILGLQGFLLCALALTPKNIQSMTKTDATNFPYIFKRWWEDSSPSSERLKAIAETLKTVDEQIPYIPLAHKMDSIKCLYWPLPNDLTELTCSRFAIIYYWSNI